MGIAINKVTALIGPSGCGKSTLASHAQPHARNRAQRSPRRRNPSRRPGHSCAGRYRLRRRVGMVFQRPNPFPKSIFDNVAYGLRINGIQDCRSPKPSKRACATPRSGTKSRTTFTSRPTNFPAASSSACASRAPSPSSPKSFCSTSRAPPSTPSAPPRSKNCSSQLKDLCTIAIVTHNMQQAARVSDFTAFLLTGQLIEFSPTPQLFTTPGDPRTEAYITGRFG